LESSVSRARNFLFFFCSFFLPALIHNTPRQATVVAKTDVTVWGLERTAYRATLMKITCDKREQYGEFLHKVPLLSSLDRYERMLICDTLEPIEYQDGDVILRQGEVGHSFFLIVSGNVRAVQRHGDKEGVVGLLGPGDYFGEIALLTDSPRQATCVAQGVVKCVYMQREDFVRVMGPLKNYVNEKIPLYKKFLGEESESVAK
jgi:cAMP-dependent protein kinase regulator